MEVELVELKLTRPPFHLSSLHESLAIPPRLITRRPPIHLPLASPSLPPSPSHPTLLSLHLLSLLSTSRTSAFHTLLETLPVPLLSADGVREIIELERGLMEGSYNKVWRMAKSLMDKDGGNSLGGLAELLVGSIRSVNGLVFQLCRHGSGREGGGDWPWREGGMKTAPASTLRSLSSRPTKLSLIRPLTDPD